MKSPATSAGRLAELSARFAASRSNLDVLQAINDQLRHQTSDAASDLQCDVMAAIQDLRTGRAQPNQIQQSRPVVQRAEIYSILQSILSDAGTAVPDGRPLHRYRVSDGRFAELRLAMDDLHRLHVLETHNDLSAAIFVLFCAEWFRREYDGGVYAWEKPNPAVINALSQNARKTLAQDGLE